MSEFWQWELDQWLAKDHEPLAKTAVLPRSLVEGCPRPEGSKAIHQFHMDDVPQTPEHQAARADYHDNIHASADEITPDPRTADLRGCAAKTLLVSPKTGQKFMLKPYHDGESPPSGWVEMCNQGMYHAGNIGDLHHRVHVAEHRVGGGVHGFAVVAFDPLINHHVLDLTYSRLAESFDYQALGHQAAKIGLMDYLIGNCDRHDLNLLVGHDAEGKSKLLAIDHGIAFPGLGAQASLFQRLAADGFRALSMGKARKHGGNPAESDIWRAGPGPTGQHPLVAAAQWWLENSDAIKKEFDRHHGYLPEGHERVKLGFDHRHEQLTKFARNVTDAGFLADPNHSPLEHAVLTK